MKIEIDDSNIELIQFITCSLIFNGGKGLPLNKIRKIFEVETFTELINNIKKLLDILGIDLRINEIDDKFFIVPKSDYFSQLEEFNLKKELIALNKKQKEILSRFLSIYISEGKNEPISKEKVRIDLRDKFGLEYTERDLKKLSKFGYINIIRNKFIDIGWRLRNSPEYQDFVNKFVDIIERLEKNALNNETNI